MKEKKYKEVDSTEREATDEASYYDGDQFELGGVQFGDETPTSRQELISSLEAHFDIQDLGLELDCETVTLSGEVDSLELKEEIDSFLLGFPRVSKVDNELSLKGEASRGVSSRQIEEADRFKMS